MAAITMTEQLDENQCFGESSEELTNDKFSCLICPPDQELTTTFKNVATTIFGRSIMN
jgi:hypothetical protein